MSNLANYSQRTVDIAAFQGTQAAGEIQLRQILADTNTGGRLVTGIVKLGQRFLIELLTEQGSLPFRKARGSTFMIEIRQQLVRTPSELFGAFSRGLLDVRRNLTAEDRVTDPLDECYGSARATNVELSAGDAKIFVSLSSLDPTARLILPINISLLSR